MASRTQKLQPSPPSQGDPSSTNLRKVFVAFLYDISDIDVLKKYYSKFGKIRNIERINSTTFMIEFETKKRSATMYRSASKIVIINRGKNYIATTALINHDVTSEKCGNTENNKVALPEAVNLSSEYPQTKMDNAADTTPTKSSRKSHRSLVQSLKCQKTTDNTFSCEQFVTETHRELCRNKTSFDKLVDIILEIPGDDHLTIKEILEKMEQYKTDFTSVEEEQLLLSRIEIISQIILLFEAEVYFDVLLIKPSEGTPVDVGRRLNYVLLDSRINTYTESACMIKVLTVRNSEHQTEQVWPLTPIVESDVGRSFELEMLNTIDEFTVKLEPSISLKLLPSVNTTVLVGEEKQRNESKNNINYPTGLIQSAKSQYTEGNVSGCVIYATEACLRLLRGETPSIVMIDEIIRSFKSDFGMQHLTIEEVLADVERFSKGLEQRGVHLIILSNLEAELQRLINDNMNCGPFGLLLVKPPEAISLIVMSQRAFVMFDSHKRSNTTGAYFEVENNALQVMRRITKIWPITHAYFDTNVGDHEQYQLNLLNMCEVHVVALSETSALPALDISKVEKKRLLRETEEQRKEIDVLRQQVHNLKMIINAVSNEK